MDNTQNDTSLTISRRKLLAGLGTVGVAAGGAGLGTSALLSDVETIVGNELRAGTLDLTLDWQQTYDGPNGLEYVNAYPDADGDGVQDPVPQSFVIWAKREGFDLSTPQGEADAIAAFKNAFFADVGAGKDFEMPLISLDDVKPGDTGEVTFSLHFFDNPAYVRMTGRKTGEAENGQTEPELVAEGEDTDGLSELDDAVEVLLWADDGDNEYEPRNGEEVDVVVLFDTSCSMEYADSSKGCNTSENVLAPTKFPEAQAGTKALFEELLAEPDVSGLGLPADMVPDADVNVGLIEFSSGASVLNNLGAGLTGLQASIDGTSPDGSTNLSEALELAKAEFDANGRPDAHRCVVVVGDGQPNGKARPDDASEEDAAAYDSWGATYSLELANELRADYGATIHTVHYEIEPEVDLRFGVQDAALLPAGYTQPLDTIEFYEVLASEDPDEDFRLAFAADRDRLTCVLEKIALKCAGEVPLFAGTLTEALSALDDGLLLVGNPRTDADPAFGPEFTRACLEWSCTYYVAFDWALPIEVGNEIQSDSVEFELGFEAEQCRHNPTPFEVEGEAEGEAPEQTTTGPA